MSSQIAFFYCSNNTIYHAKQLTSLLSSPLICRKDDRSGSLIGAGVFLYSHNEESIALFSARSLPKHTWINDNNRFQGKK